MYGIQPEILFTLYQQAKDVSIFLPYIFHDKIDIKQNEDEVIPTFFTFMSTDSEG